MQDNVSYPGKPFAVGLTLEALSAHTVDESGKEAFVTQNPLKLLRKVCIVHYAIVTVKYDEFSLRP
jgi:vacuolar protein sorting-associated protein 13A/C